jgi:cyclopropane fatty-acyl-phospholipid synthase-like methyltransferase
MRLDSFFYRFAYRFGKPRWDTAEPQPELEELVKGRPGRALDIGCGTGTDAIYLAKHGWQVVGVDFVPKAVETAKARALAGGSSASFVLGDVTQLRRAGVRGPFELLVDIGCYHAIPARLRDSYAAGVAAVAREGADFYLAGISDAPASWRLLGARGVSSAELRSRFGDAFLLQEEQTTAAVGRVSQLVLYHLVRKQLGGSQSS